METELKKINLVKLRANLPRNYAANLAKKMGKTKGAIYQVAAGEIYSLPILRELVKLATENVKEHNRLVGIIEKLRSGHSDRLKSIS